MRTAERREVHGGCTGRGEENERARPLNPSPQPAQPQVASRWLTLPLRCPPCSAARSCGEATEEWRGA